MTQRSGVSIGVHPIGQLHQQDSIHTSVQLWIVGHLSHFTPSHFASRCNQTQFTDIDFDHRTFRKHSEVGVHLRRRVFLDTHNIQLKCCFQFGVRNIRFLHAQPCGTNKPFVLWVFSSEIVSNKRAFGHHSLPSFLSLGTSSQDLEHFVISHRLDLWDGHFPLSGFFFSLLFDSVGQYLGAAHTLTIQQVSGHSALRHGFIIGVLIVALIVHGNCFAHCSLFFVSFLLVKLGPDSVDLLGKITPLVGQATFLFPLAFIGIEATTMQLGMSFHMLMLRHLECLFVVTWLLRPSFIVRNWVVRLRATEEGQTLFRSH
mmetsp:Transcript_14666/g.33193  ORF Transcript_14666/g.33193 Transcript_14666/m.33193 type:complete len:315 (-) Transcript_14666:12-956(-)